ncbi:unnamed protein product [Peniophora sp. CBMAI 1063]|nr:unnamed protein product [Peniophora sp. CBMAI 1063]
MASSSSAPAHQQPTCTDTFVRSVADVHKIFYAVLLGRLPLIARRLDAAERDALRTGSCYVWEDRGPHSVTGLGIERFTEGRSWSASRVRDDFLFYYEKYKSGSSTQPATSDNEKPPRDWDPLVKQTYSVYVNPHPGQPEPNPPKKWHLTAYYTESSIDRLRAVDNLPECQGLVVPDGMFRCSRSVKPRSRAGKAKAARERAAREKSGLNETAGAQAGPSGSAVKVKEEPVEKAEDRKPARPAKKPPPPVAGPSRVKTERTSPPLGGLRVDTTDLGPETRTPIAPQSAPPAGSNSHLIGSNIADRRAGSNIASPATAHYPASNIGGSNIQSPSVAQYGGSNIFGASSSNIGSNIQAAQRPPPQSLSLYPATANQNANTSASASASAPPHPQEQTYPFSSSSVYPSSNTQNNAYASPVYPPAPATASPTSPYPLSATSPTQGYFATGSPQPYPSGQPQPQQPQAHYRDSSGQHQQASQIPFRPASQQAFRPTSSLANALDPDAVGNSSKPGSRRSSMNYTAPTFSTAAQRISFSNLGGSGSNHSQSPSPPHTGSVGSGSGGTGNGLGGIGTMMPPPLPPLNVNASGMDAGSVDVPMGSTPAPAPAASSLDVAMGAPSVAGPSADAGDGFAQATSPVHRFPEGAGEYAGFPAPAPAPSAHAAAQDDAFAVSPAGFSAIPGYGSATSDSAGWGEQQQQSSPAYNDYGSDTYMSEPSHVSSRPTFFPPQSPYTGSHSAYAPSPNPNAAGQRPGTGYQAAAGFGGAHTPFAAHTPFQAAGSPYPGTPYQSNAAYGGFAEKGGTPFSPVVGSFAPGFQPPQMRVPRSASEGHLVSPTQTHGSFGSLNAGHAPTGASAGAQQQQQQQQGGGGGMVTGWAGERRAALAPQASLRRFKPYAKPRDPVDEASVRALGGFPVLFLFASSVVVYLSPHFHLAFS